MTTDKQRVIKFRAWHIAEKRMLDHSEMLMHQYLENAAYIEEYDLFADDNLHVMQYTGLKDKHGVEIYEGDIVKSDNHYPDVEKTVVWRNDDCRFEIHVLSNGVDLWYVLSSVTSAWLGVKGNIYEGLND